MLALEFNSERIEAKQGETLVHAARRHGSYVWFFCDGRGICQTCVCRVISGATDLGQPSEIERTGLGERRLSEGYRLGCQARLMGSGRVSVVSRAEELRRGAQKILSQPSSQTPWGHLRGFIGDSLDTAFAILSGVTITSPLAIPQLIKYPPTPARMLDYLRDTIRVTERLLNSE
jgi:ferredoxin